MPPLIHPAPPDYEREPDEEGRECRFAIMLANLLAATFQTPYRVLETPQGWMPLRVGEPLPPGARQLTVARPRPLREVIPPQFRRPLEQEGEWTGATS